MKLKNKKSIKNKKIKLKEYPKALLWRKGKEMNFFRLLLENGKECIAD